MINQEIEDDTSAPDTLVASIIIAINYSTHRIISFDEKETSIASGK